MIDRQNLPITTGGVLIICNQEESVSCKRSPRSNTSLLLMGNLSIVSMADDCTNCTLISILHCCYWHQLNSGSMAIFEALGTAAPFQQVSFHKWAILQWNSWISYGCLKFLTAILCNIFNSNGKTFLFFNRKQKIK